MWFFKVGFPIFDSYQRNKYSDFIQMDGNVLKLNQTIYQFFLTEIKPKIFNLQYSFEMNMVAQTTI